MTNVPSKLRAHSPAANIVLPRTSLSLPRTCIGLVYSQFELIKIQLKKVNYIFFCHFWEPINLMSVMDLFRIFLPAPGCQANPIAAQKNVER
jgi:hypothetical protein